MNVFVILTEGVDHDEYPAMMMKEITAPRGRILTFVCKGELSYSQPNIEVKVVSYDEEKLPLQKELLDPVAVHRRFTNQQLDIVRYHLNCIGISCRIH